MFTIIEEGKVKVTKQGIEEILKNSKNWNNNLEGKSSGELGIIALKAYHFNTNGGSNFGFEPLPENPEEVFNVIKNVPAAYAHMPKNSQYWLKD